jgi:hypothetical protein
MPSVAYISIFAAAFLCCQLSAQDVSSIIDHIQSEQAHPAGTPATQPAQGAAVPDHPVRRKHQITAPVASGPVRSNATYFHPKDRLPGNIAGQYLIGDFCVLGEYIDGGAVIYAVEDEGKGTFIRQFVVKNASSGLAPGNYYPEGRKPRVSYTESNPLVFTRKLFPGLYAVQTVK